MGHFLLTVFLFVNCASLVSSHGDVWDYSSGANGPENWGGDCQTGKKQSPINIESAKATYDKNLGSFNLTNYNTTPNVNFTAENDGHGFKIGFADGIYSVSGGGLDGTYKTVQFHFHWGSNNTQGSEHTVNDKQYPAEVHFVSYNKKYADISASLGHADGLAVLGALIEVGGENNTAFSFLEYTKDFAMGRNKTDILPFTFTNILPANKTTYFRYMGSLTTPACNEVVSWTVFNDTVKISQYQIDLLRGLKKKDDGPLVDTYRPVQDLHGREVKASFPTSEEQTTDGTTAGGTTAGGTTAGGTTAGGTTKGDSTTKGPTAGASAVSMPTVLFLSMLFAAISVY